MKIISIECPNCREEAEVTPGAVLVDPHNSSADDAMLSATTAWVCEICDEFVAVPVHVSALPQLMIFGAAFVDTDSADLPPHPEIAIGGADFTLDDLLEFHELMRDEMWLIKALHATLIGSAQTPATRDATTDDKS